MPKPNYLFEKAGYFHFRRRISELSTYIPPVQVALGTTDQKTALTWIRTLTIEFDTVLDTFLYISDPLPEGLIAQFVRVRIQLVAEQLFDNLRHARKLIAAWRIDFNHHRPHTSLAGLTPAEYAIRSEEDENLNRAHLD